MIGLRLAFAAILLTGCGLIVPTSDEPQVALVIVNESDDPMFWSVEQPSGEMTRFEIQPCSSMSEAIAVDRAWEVEWGATFAVTSADVQPLDAPYTVVEVRFGPGGAVDVAAPRMAPEQPSAPDDLPCFRR